MLVPGRVTISSFDVFFAFRNDDSNGFRNDDSLMNTGLARAFRTCTQHLVAHTHHTAVDGARDA